jgi:hypothetical protein
MSRKQCTAPLLVGIVLIGLSSMFWAISPPAVQAQCVDYPEKSSCYTCHEESYPVFVRGEWHEIHARKDCCWNCHGGNAQAQDKDLAHAGMTLQPLQDTYTDCFACHPYDYQVRADRFGEILGVVPISREPPTRSSPPSAPEAENQIVILPTPEPVVSPATMWYPEPLWLALGLLLLLSLMMLNRIRFHNKNA